MNREDTGELPFHADFAERVLETADAISLRRRRARRAVLAAAVLLLAGAGTLGALRSVPARPPAADGTPHLVTGFDTAYDAQTEPTDYMFPEAADLAQFSDEYAGADDRALFAEDEEDEGE
jgi:hypothetical protein